MSETKNNKERNNGENGLAIILVLFTIAFFLHCIDAQNSITSYSEWGEFVGGIFGTIIAGIACIYVYKTYISQKKELEKTNETAEKQQFETTFFSLIRIHKENLKAIHYTEEYVECTDAMDDYHFVSDLQHRLKEGTLLDIERRDFIRKRQLQGEDALRAIYESNKKQTELLLSYYYSAWFNSIYMILKYLKDNGKKAEDFYAQFFYSQITRPEWWLMYDISQSVEIINPDPERYHSYVALVKEMKLYDYGFIHFVAKK